MTVLYKGSVFLRSTSATLNQGLSDLEKASRSPYSVQFGRNAEGPYIITFAPEDGSESWFQLTDTSKDWLSAQIRASVLIQTPHGEFRGHVVDAISFMGTVQELATRAALSYLSSLTLTNTGLSRVHSPFSWVFDFPSEDDEVHFTSGVQVVFLGHHFHGTPRKEITYRLFRKWTPVASATLPLDESIYRAVFPTVEDLILGDGTVRTLDFRNLAWEPKNMEFHESERSILFDFAKRLFSHEVSRTKGDDYPSRESIEYLNLLCLRVATHPEFPNFLEDLDGNPSARELFENSNKYTKRIFDLYRNHRPVLDFPKDVLDGLRDYQRSGTQGLTQILDALMSRGLPPLHVSNDPVLSLHYPEGVVSFHRGSWGFTGGARVVPEDPEDIPLMILSRRWVDRWVSEDLRG